MKTNKQIVYRNIMAGALLMRFPPEMRIMSLEFGVDSGYKMTKNLDELNVYSSYILI